MQQLGGKGFRMLMVDDSPEDAFFVKHALEKSGFGESFYSLNNGEEAVAYLRGEGQFADRNRFPFPNILLLDLKMPGMDGYQLLQWLRSHEECNVIPTIVFTSSRLESDIQHVYVLGGNAYLVKPSDLEELVDLIQVTFRFWSRCCIPQPPRGQRCE